jgi:carbamoyltransferase
MVFGVPRRSIRMILDSHHLSPKDIDTIAIATNNQHFIGDYVDFKEGWFGLRRSRFKQALFEVASNVSKLRAYFPFMEGVYYAVRRPAFRKRRRELSRLMREEFGFTCPIDFVDHHYAHVVSAYYTSGYRNATVFSLDGGGDGKCCRAYDVVDGKFTELVSIPSFASLGTLYSYVTQLCGFKAGKHEGKITGLAAYGEPRYLDELRRLLVFRDGTFHNIGNVFFLSALREMKRLLPRDFRHRDLAASIQVHAEQLSVGLIQYWLERTGQTRIGLAGGVTANVKINQRVHEIPGVTSVFVHPGMADDGMPVGAALARYFDQAGHRYDPDTIRVMEHVYLGPEYTDEEIKAVLDAHALPAEHCDEIEAAVARAIADGAVVARFNGRMEYGPRALGNRSILYQATDPAVQYWMNDALGRTEFMPFAPIVMAEHARRCFEGIDGAEDTARFMTITFNCTDWMREHCPAVVHVDNTARPQLVSKRDNPSMYKILERYHEISGLPCMINTSFNMHEEPIVCSPEDAVRAFMLGHLDYLAIGNWLVKNPNPARRQVDSKKYEAGLNATGARWG